MYSYILSFNIGYVYSKYTADDYITYRPSHKFTSSVSLNSDKWSLAWGNDYSSSVYVETNGSEKLDGALIGSMVLQVQVVESVLLNLKMENLYNDHYRYRDGYPEPGFTILGGLRILL
ncbi:MAG: TonB-dependent receptor, partial [Spirochaetia bacterium]|jgi:outer membrane cobalamin receptor|nr:TonB-dependent receptor [Spirochaetia bacterium]